MLTSVFASNHMVGWPQAAPALTCTTGVCNGTCQAQQLLRPKLRRPPLDPEAETVSATLRPSSHVNSHTPPLSFSSPCSPSTFQLSQFPILPRGVASPGRKICIRILVAWGGGGGSIHSFIHLVLQNASYLSLHSSKKIDSPRAW